MKKLTIIARYNEDLSWTSDVDADILIFNKGDDWTYDFPRVELINKGREADTFLFAINNLYESLNQYDYIIFLQGNPFDHHSKTVEIINDYNDNKILPLTNHTNPIDFTLGNHLFGKHICLLENFYEPTSVMNAHYKNHEGIVETDAKIGKEFLQMRFVCLMCGISLEDKKIAWPSGAQYIVPTRYILNKSKKWWYDLYLLFQGMSLFIQPGELTAECIFERLWLLFYSHQEKENNVLIPCSDI